MMNAAATQARALAGRCREVSGLADAATHWLGDGANREKVGAEAASLRREFRRAVIRTRKLAVAAERNMCVGVYGPSQAGKSYLISILGRPKDGELMAAFDGAEPLKYLDKINPEGQGESTGLVTRFTTARASAPAGFPVKVRFLSESDVVRILANAFAMDGDGSEPVPSPDEIERLLADAEARAGTAADAAFPAEEMWDVLEYLSSDEFGRLAYFASLRAYWDRAAAVAPRLDPVGRAALLSILWGRHARLTEVFQTLASHLKKLGDVREAFIPLGAIIPREESIIDVQTLKELDGQGAFGPVEVRAASGTSATIPRGELTALVAEMIVPMADRPWDFLSETDLLDFPGTRNRFTYDLASFLKAGESPLAQLFLRGKVAYLFDRYVAEQELTSMLLCIGDGNMEAKELPGLMERWVALTHGATPQERVGARCILFFVLTKFDTLLLESGGAGDDPRTRFDRRVQNSMLEPFGKLPDSWLNDWAGGKPFRNAFWLRNPEYEAAVIEYKENGREIGIRDSMRSRVDALREGAVRSPLVCRHFADPDAAWNAAMQVDDGGVSRLARALAEVCVPEVKLAQVDDQLRVQIQTLRRRLAPFYVSSDVETRLAEKRAAADQLVEALYSCFDRKNRWGELMEALVVDSGRIADEIVRIPGDIHIVTGPEAARTTPSSSAGNGAARPRPGRPRPGGGGVVPRRQTVPADRALVGDPALEMRRMTMEAFQAERALAVWMEALHAFLGRPERLARYSLTEATASDLVGELIEASRRLGLDARIRAALERWNFSLRSERRAGPAATVAAELINAFVARLGMDQIPEAERPVVDTGGGVNRPVFEGTPVRYAFRTLPDRPELTSEDRLLDWTFALHRAFEDNARSVDGVEVDMEQNLRLGEILAGLSADGTTSAGGSQ